MRRAKSATAPVPSSTHDSALKSLIRGAVDYEGAGRVLPLDLLQFGLLGSAFVVLAGVIGLALPSAHSIQHSGFFLLFGSTTASLDSFIGAAAAPAMIFGGSLLLLDAYLMQVRTSGSWVHSAVVAQAAAGGGVGIVCTAFLALIVLNLGLWIAIFALVLILIGVVLGAAGG